MTYRAHNPLVTLIHAKISDRRLRLSRDSLYCGKSDLLVELTICLVGFFVALGAILS